MFYDLFLLHLFCLRAFLYKMYVTFLAGAYPPFMPPGGAAHGLPAEIPSSYSNGVLHNNISPNPAIGNYHRPLFDPHPPAMRPGAGMAGIPGGKP